MKATNKQILAFVEELGGLQKLMEALENGAKLVTKADEALTVKKAELAVAAEANESLETDLEKANSLLESNSKQRRSGQMFRKDSKLDESNSPKPKRDLTSMGRLIAKHKK